MPSHDEAAEGDFSDFVGPSRRRDVSLVGLLVAAGAPGLERAANAEASPGSSPKAVASEPATAPATASKATGPAAAKIQRTVIDVADSAAVDKEIKFWKEACMMKVVSDSKGSDGNRVVEVGFGEKSDAYTIEIKVDPSAATRKRPSLLNYSVMQPTVPALNFTQIGAPGQIFDMYARVENSGGSALVGDARYLDCESPRGVQVRLVPRSTKPSVELVSLNVEVPAFDATVKFYKRTCGFSEIKYQDSEAPIQKLSVYMTSSAGGPKLLLSPVPDYRVMQRDRDCFVNFVITAPSAQQVASAAEKAIELGKQELEKKKEEEKKRLISAGEKVPDEIVLEGTISRPTLKLDGKEVVIDDGIGNIIVVQDAVVA